MNYYIINTQDGEQYGAVGADIAEAVANLEDMIGELDCEYTAVESTKEEVEQFFN